MVTIWFRDTLNMHETMHVQVSNLRIAGPVWDRLRDAGFMMLSTRP